ncbi:conserved hypothetical protein [Ricinus communis]|uniref:Uncharacterized protein n=1 Tax=Ricinus communis TaxID=3988 RepID=B9TC79_RICCO|nr:conserved hypothetical protein [Ricinus communis]
MEFELRSPRNSVSLPLVLALTARPHLFTSALANPGVAPLGNLRDSPGRGNCTLRHRQHQ